MATKSKTLAKIQPKKAPKYLLWVLVVVLVFAGIVLIRQIFASSIPVFGDNPDYWRPRIAQCESGGNYQASNGTHFGAYQYDLRTWKGAVGPELAAQYPDPRQAPPAVQDQAFYNTFARRGTQPWNASYRCWIKGANVPSGFDDSSSATKLPNAASQVITQVSTPPPNPFGITSGSYNVLVTGRLTLNNSPIGGVQVQTCSGDRVATTDADGRFGFGIPVNNSFCVRVSGDLPAGARLERTNNTVEHAKAASYENQRAGVDCYHSVWCLLSDAYTWDRRVDIGYNFFYVSP